MRLTTIFAQSIERRAERTTGSTREGKRRQRVEGVVLAANAQCIGRHQTLHHDVFFDYRTALALDGFVGLQRAHQPGHAIDTLDAEIGRPQWQAGTESDVGAGLRTLQPGADRRRQHVHHSRIVTVEDHQAARAEDARLGSGVGGHVAMPVQMVLRQVEDNGSGGLEILHAIELEAGEFEHPDIGQRAGVDVCRQGVEQGRADVAGDGHGLAGALDQLASERGDGRLAVGAGDGQHGGPVARLRQGPGHDHDRCHGLVDHGGKGLWRGRGQFSDPRDEFGRLAGNSMDTGAGWHRRRDARHGRTGNRFGRLGQDRDRRNAGCVDVAISH